MTDARSGIFDGGGAVLVRGAAGAGRTTICRQRFEALLAQRTFMGRRTLWTNPHAGAAADARAAFERARGPLPEGAEIVGFDELCLRLLAGVAAPDAAPIRLLPDAWRRDLLADAIAAVRRPAGRSVWQRSAGFFADEITQVITGHGITDRATYLALDREGRIQRLEIAHRQAVWEVWLAYRERVAATGMIDADELPGRTLTALVAAAGASGTTAVYDDVIVDDAQGLLPVALRLVRQITEPAGTILITLDEDQRIHRTGFTLREAGIALRGGRSHDLPAPTHGEPALRAWLTELLDDDAPPRAEPRRPSPSLRVRTADTFAGQFPVVAACAREALDEGRAPGEIAVIVRFARQVAMVEAALGAAGIQVCAAGVPGITVVTADDARGRVAPVVVLGDVNRSVWPMDPSDSSPETQFAERRRLYVAASRARSILFIVHRAGHASPFLPAIGG